MSAEVTETRPARQAWWRRPPWSRTLWHWPAPDLNPVLAHEWRGRSRLLQKVARTRESRWVMVLVFAFVYLAFLATVLNEVWRDRWSGEDVMLWTSGIALALVCLLAPGLTATAIVTERQKGSWDLLLATRLRPVEIVLGKLEGRLAGLALMLVLVAPVALVAVLDPDSWYLPYLPLAALCVLPTAMLGLGVIGLVCSARCRNAATATAAAYAITLVLVVGVPLLEAVFSSFDAGADVGLYWITCPFATWQGIAETLSGTGYNHNELALWGPWFYLFLTAGGLALLLNRFDSWRRGEPRHR